MILIVDDKPENIFSLKSLLTLHKFEVDTAESGEEALKKVLDTVYSLIILDVQMPGMDGFEVADAISNFNKAKNTPIIFLSAVNTDKKFITRGYTSGGTDYVTKPVDADILLLKVKTFHKLSEQTRELQKTQITLRREIELRKQAQQEQAESMQELRAVMEAMPQIAFTLGKAGEVQYVNEKWYEYSPEKKIFPTPHQDDGHILNEWREALENGSEFMREIRIKRLKGNKYQYNLLRITPIFQDGNLIKWVGTFTDIHRQKTLNEVLEHRVIQRTRDLVLKNKELANSNHELQQFAWVASHDLKEPLRKIQTFNYLIKDKFLNGNDEAAMYLDRAIKSSKRMSDLIDNLLQYSRLSASAVFESADLNLLLQEIISDLEVSIFEKKAVINIGPMPIIDIVPSQMRQVFQNLISNALKFSREDVPPVVQITCECIAGDSPVEERCLITISDNGIGFDEKFTDRIFVIFQRLHTRDAYEGTGIGLAITKKIIERHNGTITASSRENEGTSFFIHLPLKNNQ
ncbi:MAG TPA: response regulator [Bacteroidia bacterium]|nr:response regulator [Bacteroidia bacterium]